MDSIDDWGNLEFLADIAERIEKETGKKIDLFPSDGNTYVTKDGNIVSTHNYNKEDKK